jgi:hypothetical protein
MTSSMFAPVDDEAVSGGDPRNVASSAGHPNRLEGGVLAVDSLIAASSDLSSNASASRLDGLSRYEAECTTELVLSSSLHHQPRSRAQQSSQAINGSCVTGKRRGDEDTFSQRLGVNHSPNEYTAAEMQSATQFYLNFNPAFAHHGQFSAPGFATPYMPHYPIAASLNPNSYPLHAQQQQQQPLQPNR